MGRAALPGGGRRSRAHPPAPRVGGDGVDDDRRARHERAAGAHRAAGDDRAVRRRAGDGRQPRGERAGAAPPPGDDGAHGAPGLRLGDALGAVVRAPGRRGRRVRAGHDRGRRGPAVGPARRRPRHGRVHAVLLRAVPAGRARPAALPAGRRGGRHRQHVPAALRGVHPPGRGRARGARAVLRGPPARAAAGRRRRPRGAGGGLADPDLDPLLRAQARLNATALAVADRLDDADDDPAARRPVYLPGGARPGGPDDAETEIAGLRQWIVDSELAAERVAMSIRRTVEHHDPIPGPDREALAAGVRALAAATAVGTPRAIAARLYQEAREAVGEIVGRPGGTGAEAREQRIGFAVLRLADAVQSTIEEAWRGIARRRDAPGEDPSDDDTGGAGLQGGPELHTRQAVQVGVATSLAIVVGELISPARWYWAVIAAFVVFAGTASRGDVLSRGWARAVGTAGGVVAGMLLALLVAGNLVASLLLLFACVFLALYLVRISQAMMAFWITAVLALLYGVIGQFSVETMLLRVEETVVGGALGMLAAYLILPTRSRTAFAEALDDALTAVDVSLRCSVDRALGRPGENPLEKAREVDEAVATVRERARPLEDPVARRPLRRGVHHTVWVVGALDHYTRLLAAQAAVAHVPEWATSLDPATDRVRQNVDGLRRILVDGWGPAARREHAPGTSPADYGVGSAEDLIDAAEADAASSGPATGRTGGAVDPFGALPAGHGATDTAGWVAPADPRTRDSAAGAPPGDRLRRLAAARLLGRIDQLAVGLARELSGGTRHEAPEPRTGTDGTRSGPG
ncbi:hypothetical protein Ae263Ps1_4802 [Pseudonocardia sp. Ae263_Ps1]|nr:hypothetical protein Ae263Ps1_4802 [Pseudonocardia sp. Ae263_Ps1]OLL92227.1 hypothetical protein Ae356Ps1_2124c [Pseudonocardia sp. Ae356_Ps1]